MAQKLVGQWPGASSRLLAICRSGWPEGDGAQVLAANHFSARKMPSWPLVVGEGGVARGQESGDRSQGSEGKVTHPTPPANWNWQRGSNFSRKSGGFPVLGIHLAEGVSNDL